jgi:hypothetical protein
MAEGPSTTATKEASIAASALPAMPPHLLAQVEIMEVTLALP